MKIRELLKNGIIKLNEYEVQDAVLKARKLLQYELQMTNEKLVICMDEELEASQIERFARHIQEIIDGKPIQYIVNQQEFYGLNFYVNEDVLIPQPDTEVLVEEVIHISNCINKPHKILDICTGSGAIGVALAKNTNAEVVASDISEKALQIAKRNATDNSVDITFIQSNMFENIHQKFDIIVSNPPYIETETIKDLSDEVKNEPIIALDGGEDGLKFYRILASEAPKYLKNNGILAVEIGYLQGQKVKDIFEKAGFCDVTVKKDFGDNNRVVIGTYKKPIG